MAEEPVSQKVPIAADFETMQARIAVLLAKRESHVKALSAKTTRSPLVTETEDEKATRLAGIIQSLKDAAVGAKTLVNGLPNGKRQDMGDNGRLRHIMTGKSEGLQASKPREDGGKGKDGKRGRKLEDSDDEDEGRSGLGKGKKAKLGSSLSSEPRKTAVHPAAQQNIEIEAKVVRKGQGHVGSSPSTGEGLPMDSRWNNIPERSKEAIKKDNVKPEKKRPLLVGLSDDEDSRSSSASLKSQKVNPSVSASKSILKRPTSSKQKPTPSIPDSQSAQFNYEIPDETTPSPKQKLPSRPISKPKPTLQADNNDSDESDLDTAPSTGLPASAFFSTDDTHMADASPPSATPELKKQKLREKKRRQKLAKKERDKAAKSASAMSP